MRSALAGLAASIADLTQLLDAFDTSEQPLLQEDRPRRARIPSGEAPAAVAPALESALASAEETVRRLRSLRGFSRQTDEPDPAEERDSPALGGRRARRGRVNVEPKRLNDVAAAIARFNQKDGDNERE